MPQIIYKILFAYSLQKEREKEQEKNMNVSRKHKKTHLKYSPNDQMMERKKQTKEKENTYVKEITSLTL